MTTKYRELGPHEIIQKGDEWFDKVAIRWDKTMWSEKANKTPFRVGNKYRRPIGTPFVPQWRQPEAPSVPVHVLWAETPVGTPTVASSAAAAKPAPSKSIPEPGEGYRLVRHGELIESGDEWLRGDGVWYPSEKGDEWLQKTGRWQPALITSRDGIVLSPGGSPLRRKIKVDTKPKYRPYADTDEAARALEGKFIKIHNLTMYYSILRIENLGVTTSDNCFSDFKELVDAFVFTDGTPCGVLVTE